MRWNWEQSNWPGFSYDPATIEPLERLFLLRAGEFIGACKHVSTDDQDRLKIELISDEAIKTSEIEGELLNRDSVRLSINSGWARTGRTSLRRSAASPK